MSAAVTCDLCGDALDQDEWVILWRTGTFRYVPGPLQRDFCRQCYSRVSDAIEALAPERQDRNERWRQWDEQRAAWRRSPIEYRENVVLNALGDERLPIGELTARVNAQLGGTAGDVVYDSGVQSLCYRLLAAGQLGREHEPTERTRPRWRYFRRRDLAGPIADLERAYHDDREEG